MATKNSTHVAAVFSDPQDARRATQALKDAGFTEAQIGVAGQHTEGGDADDKASAAGSGAVAGAATGAGLGALWGLGILAGFLPAIGPAIAGGTLAAILSSAAAGAAAAGLAGALLGMGFSKDEAEYYDNEMKAGRTIVTVNAGNRRDEAIQLLRSFHGYDFETRDSDSRTHAHGENAFDVRSTGTAHHAQTPHRESGEGTTIQAHEEQLRVRKQPVETGEVRVRKDVHTEHKTIDVPVTREEVVIERRPASGHSVSGGQFGRNEIRIPVKEEQVHVEKETIAREEVAVGKRTVQTTQQVDADLRKEEIHI